MKKTVYERRRKNSIEDTILRCNFGCPGHESTTFRNLIPLGADTYLEDEQYQSHSNDRHAIVSTFEIKKSCVSYSPVLLQCYSQAFRFQNVKRKKEQVWNNFDIVLFLGPIHSLPA